MKRSTLSLMYLIQGMCNAGIDLNEKLSHLGLKVEAIDPSSIINVHLEQEILNVLCQHFVEYDGLNIGQHYTLAGYGPLLMLLVSSPNIETALQKAVQFCRLTHLSGQLEYSSIKEQIVIEYHPLGFNNEMDRFIAQCEVAGTFKFLENLYQMMQLSFPQICVELPFNEPKSQHDQGEYQKIYGANVRFNSDSARFWLNKDILKVEIPSYDPITFHIYEQKCIKALKRLSEKEKFPSIVQRVRDYLVLQHSNMPTMAETAQVLKIPERTLRHQLQQHQTSYKKIREDIIKHKAVEMIEYKKYSIEMISELLGYSEPSAFNHAFKRWFGQSPRQYLK